MEQTALDVLRLCNTYLDFNMVHTPDLRKCINNKKVTGHHAIIPTSGIATADLDGLPAGEKNILVLVARKLMCASAPAHKYEAVKVTAGCGGTEFTASGKTVLDMGWKRYAVKSADDKEDDKSLPVLTEGQVLTGSLSKGEHFTNPPKPYTEDTLLSAMEHARQDEYNEDRLSADAHDIEKKGLGTPATRAAVIESLVKNGYAERKGKQIIPTDRGIDLVSVVPEEVKSAKLTAEWEMKLQQVEHGQYSADSFMSEIEQNVREMCGKYGKFGWYCKGKCGMNVAKVFGVTLSDAQVKGLLNGKSTSYMKNGRKTIVLPEVVPNEYQGKTYYN